MLAKLANSGKGGRQTTVIQETLRTPRTATNNMAEVQQIDTLEGVKRSHRSLTQETLKTPRISVYPVARERSLQVCLVEAGETWMTPYQRYLADGVLPLEPTEARKIKKNSSKSSDIDVRYRHLTSPIEGEIGRRWSEQLYWAMSKLCCIF